MASSPDSRNETLPVRISWPFVRDRGSALHLFLSLVGIVGGSLFVQRARQAPEPIWLVGALVAAGVAALALANERPTKALEWVRGGTYHLGAPSAIRWKRAVVAVGLAAAVVWQVPSSRWPADLLVLVWVGSLLAYIWSLAPTQNVRAGVRALPRSVVAGLALVAWLALWWRWAGLDRAPWPVARPEAHVILGAVHLLPESGSWPFGGTASGTTGLLAYLHVLGLRLLGDAVLGARAVSALAGVGTVLLLFHLADELCGRTAALAAALVLAGMALHVHYSRLALEYGPALFFSTAGLWAVVRATRTTLPRWWGAAGVLLGVGVMVSPLAWLAVLLTAWWLVLTAWLVPDEWRWQWPRLTWLVVGGGLAVAPRLALGEGVVELGPFVPGVVALGEWTRGSAAGLVAVVQETGDAFLGWLAYGDQGGLYGVAGPLLDLVSRFLMLAGLGALAARGTERRALWLGGWLALVALADGLTLRAPSSHVLLFGAPAIALLVAVGSQEVWHVLFHGQPPIERALRVVAFTALSVALVVLLNVTFYFNTYLPRATHVSPDARIAAEVARLIQAHPDAYVYLYGGPTFSLDHPVLRLLAPNVVGQNGKLPPDPLPADRPVLIVWLPGQAAAVEFFMEAYTGLNLRSVTGHDGSLLFFWALAEPGQLAPRR